MLQSCCLWHEVSSVDAVLAAVTAHLFPGADEDYVHVTSMERPQWTMDEVQKAAKETKKSK